LAEPAPALQVSSGAKRLTFDRVVSKVCACTKSAKSARYISHNSDVEIGARASGLLAGRRRKLCRAHGEQLQNFLMAQKVQRYSNMLVQKYR